MVIAGCVDPTLVTTVAWEVASPVVAGVGAMAASDVKMPSVVPIFVGT